MPATSKQPRKTRAKPRVVLDVGELSKRYGAREALKDVSFEARRGELLAIIGPNGAGKTTLLSILAGVIKPDGGEISREAGEVGWVPQGAAVYQRLTVAENLRLFARLERLGDVEAAVERMLDQAGLGERRDDPIGELSGGNRQRVNIAIGLLSRPEVLLLDEPSAGLDPRQRERLWEFVSGLAGAGTTVIFSTHHIHEAEHQGDRLLVLADGERLFDGSSRQFHAAVARQQRTRSGAAAGRGPGKRGGGRGDFERAFVAFLAHRGH